MVRELFLDVKQTDLGSVIGKGSLVQRCVWEVHTLNFGIFDAIDLHPVRREELHLAAN